MVATCLKRLSWNLELPQHLAVLRRCFRGAKRDKCRLMVCVRVGRAYARVSTFDQQPETQLLDLRRLAEQRGFEIVREYTDKISGAKAKRPALDQMLAAAHRRECDVVLVWAADRLARSVRHSLEVLDTLHHLGIEFVSFRENLDAGGPLGRAVVVIVSAVAELERNLIIERVRAGLRRARLEGRSEAASRHAHRVRC